MRTSYNPITQRILNLHSPGFAPCLHHWCRNTILQSLTLPRIERVLGLPLPNTIAKNISRVSLKDFLIDSETLTSTNHHNRSYPATCLFDNSKVIIKIQPAGSQINTSHPSFLVAFDEDEYQCCVYTKTDSLQDIIEECRNNGSILSDHTAWKVIKEFCRWVLLNANEHSGKLSTSVIMFTADGRIFFDLTECENGQQDITSMDVATSMAVYEAPEILTRNNPDEQAFVWSLGCVIYEILALKPAYVADGDNPFAIYKTIIEGELPPNNLRGGQALIDLVWSCLQLNPRNRPTINDILIMADSRVE